MLPMNLCTAHSFSHLFSVSTFLSRNKIYRDITQNIFCLQVIANSVLLLNPSDVLKLLHSLQSIIHSRWTIICLIKICLVNLTDHVCVICPWFFFFKFVPNSNNYFFWIIIVCGFSFNTFYSQDSWKAEAKVLFEFDPNISFHEVLWNVILLQGFNLGMCSSLAKKFTSSTFNWNNVPGIFFTCFEFLISGEKWEPHLGKTLKSDV